MVYFHTQLGFPQEKKKKNLKKNIRDLQMGLADPLGNFYTLRKWSEY